MQVRCPNCHSAIEIVPEAEQDTRRCPSCGGLLSILDDTLPYAGPELRQVEHFLLLEHVGHGQFGDVWKARDTHLDRLVAIKIPRTRHLDPSTRALFLREAQAAAQLRHPHIVTVHEVGSVDDTIYIASDFIDGVTLKDRIAQRRLTPQEAAQLCGTVAGALQHAHEAGVIHRDLKPGNILLDGSGQPHLTDFGLAKREGAEVTVAVQGHALGTPAYMPPEQARGDAHHADARSDVYSLGVILYELLTGGRPFRGEKRMLRDQILHDEPPALRQVVPGVPRDLETICLKALAKDPARRYPTARAMAEDLQCYLEGRPIQARPVGHGERTWRWMRRNPALACSSVTAVVASLALLIAGIWYGVWSAVNSPLRTVTLATTPAGATVVFIPLDPKTGEPQPQLKTHPGTSPIRRQLLPGDYLVVACLDPQQFHEVYRHVPDLSEKGPDAPYRQRRWREIDGRVELPEIRIPLTTITEDMALVPGGSFEMGAAALKESAPPHQREVPDFYLDATEVSVAQFRQVLRDWPHSLARACLTTIPPPDYPVSCVSFDEALDVAESLGKRLPDEAEYEFAARAGGTRVFPWGEDVAAPEMWPIGPVGAVAIDRVEFAGQPPIRGLCSGVAEWTVSWKTLYPDHVKLGLPQPADAALMRVVRGGDTTVMAGGPAVDAQAFHPCARTSQKRSTAMPGLGFRCARSAKPRLEPDDFVKVRP